ncbi:MAG: hypothetical protein Q8P42_00685 [Gallionella sp.]|nr:hypothetical protein [Gallionella sp.]
MPIRRRFGDKQIRAYLDARSWRERGAVFNEAIDVEGGVFFPLNVQRAIFGAFDGGVQQMDTMVEQIDLAGSASANLDRFAANGAFFADRQPLRIA